MQHLSDALDSFRCYQDGDIENFLRKKAFEYLDHGWCSVYLLLDEEKFDEGQIKIDAYFTLSHKSLKMPEECDETGKQKISKSTIRKLTGGFSVAETIQFVLIGQLGKYKSETVDGKIIADITSGEILDEAFEIIRASNELIPCRCVLVECSEEPKVHKAYIDYGFKLFQFDGKHYQFYKRI